MNSTYAILFCVLRFITQTTRGKHLTNNRQRADYATFAKTMDKDYHYFANWSSFCSIIVEAIMQGIENLINWNSKNYVQEDLRW